MSDLDLILPHAIQSLLFHGQRTRSIASYGLGRGHFGSLGDEINILNI
jgi:hypothetical protein